MYALHRAPRACARLAHIRGNATVQAAASAEAVTPPPPPPAQEKAQTVSPSPAPRPATAKAPEKYEAKQEQPAEQADATTKRRRVQWPTSRPSISLERPRQYMRPIGVGVLPVYDRALEYIKQDSETLKRQLASVNTQLQKAAENTNVEEVEKLKKRAQILEVQSEINLPSVRWKARNGLADLSQPVYRHLVEQKWREDGALDLVMERVHQMNVVPDLLGELHPSFDLRVNFPERLSDEIRMRNRTKAKVEKMEPGVFLLPEQTRKPPALYTTVFHEEPRLYTMLMVDLDVPNPEHQGFQSYLHWMHPNITLHAFSQNPVPLTGTHTPYVPPHPQRGTPYHRYVLLLVPQASPTERIKIPAISMEQRLGFDYRAFAANHGLDASKGGGVFMWREVWDETVSRIHAETLKTEEPVFGRMPKEDLYAVFKTTKRYH